MMKRLSLENIKTIYPREWVLIGNPEEKNGELTGIVIVHDASKKELVKKAVKKQHNFQNTILRFTGTHPENGKWLKFIPYN